MTKTTTKRRKKMTDTYIMGFCKKAEEYGIDPVLLSKFAEVSEENKKALSDLAEKTKKDGTKETRKNIKALKNTLLGVLAGGITGSAINSMRHFGAFRSPSTKDMLLGAGLGSASGGLIANLLDRLHNYYYESAGFDPTVPGMQVYNK